MERWNEIETVMKKLVEEGNELKLGVTDDFFFLFSEPLPQELEPYRVDFLLSLGDFEFLWSQTHPMD